MGFLAQPARFEAKNNPDFPGGLLKTDGWKRSRLNGERRFVVDTCCLFGVREHEVTVQQLSGRRQGPVTSPITESRGAGDHGIGQ